MNYGDKQRWWVHDSTVTGAGGTKALISGLSGQVAVLEGYILTGISAAGTSSLVIVSDPGVSNVHIVAPLWINGSGEHGYKAECGLDIPILAVSLGLQSAGLAFDEVSATLWGRFEDDDFVSSARTTMYQPAALN